MEPDMIIRSHCTFFVTGFALIEYPVYYFSFKGCKTNLHIPHTRHHRLVMFSLLFTRYPVSGTSAGPLPTPCSNWNAPPWTAPACICTSWPYQFTAPAAVGLIRSFLPECLCVCWCPSRSTRTRLRQCVCLSVSRCVRTYLFVALLRVFASAPRLIRV